MKDRLKRGFMVSVLVLEHNFNILRSTFTWLVALYDARFLRARDDMRRFWERFTASLALIISAKRLADFSRARLARGLQLSRIWRNAWAEALMTRFSSQNNVNFGREMSRDIISR